jgi:hypothetical protein
VEKRNFCSYKKEKDVWKNGCLNFWAHCSLIRADVISATSEKSEFQLLPREVRTSTQVEVSYSTSEKMSFQDCRTAAKGTPRWHFLREKLHVLWHVRKSLVLYRQVASRLCVPRFFRRFSSRASERASGGRVFRPGPPAPSIAATSVVWLSSHACALSCSSS